MSSSAAVRAGDIKAAVRLLESAPVQPDRTTHLLPFRGEGLRFQTATDHEKLLAGPADSAKTMAGLWAFDEAMRSTPRAVGAIVRKVRGDISRTVGRTFEPIGNRGGVRKVGGESDPDQYVYPKGGVVDMVGMDRPERVLSAEYDFIYVNQAESLSSTDWEMLSGRVTGRAGHTRFPWIGGDCNPGPSGHWILKRPTLRLFHCYHKDNPSIYDDAGRIIPGQEMRLQALSDLTGVRRERLYLGKWVGAEGQIYHEFDRAVHLIRRSALPPMRRYFLAVDFGHTHPFVCQLWGEDADGRIYLLREVYRTKRLVEEHAKAIRLMTAGLQIAFCVADSEDPEGMATLAKHGVPNEGAKKGKGSVKNGIQLCEARFKILADGKPRIRFVDDDAVVDPDPELLKAHVPASTVDEIEGYVRKPGSEDPQECLDDGCLVAGTMVSTERGDRPIETIRAGDRVLTRAGYRAVIAAGMTAASARVVTAILRDGRRLTGTPNHPVWCDGDFQRLDAMRYNATLCDAREVTGSPLKSHSTVSFTAGIRSRSPYQQGTTFGAEVPTPSKASGLCIEISGRSSMGPYPPTTRSTTLTRIRSTTRYQTWKRSRLRSTEHVTSRAEDSVLQSRGKKDRKRRELKPLLNRSYGAKVRKVVRDFVKTLKLRASVHGLRATVIASDAAKCSLLENSRSPSSVLARVSQQLDSRPESMMRIGSAGFARSRSGSISTSKSKYARSGVLASRGKPAKHARAWSVAVSSRCKEPSRSVFVAPRVLTVTEEATRQDVFNLTVDGAPEFFANGVLVHNCSAMRYLVTRLDSVDKPDYDSVTDRETRVEEVTSWM